MTHNYNLRNTERVDYYQIAFPDRYKQRRNEYTCPDFPHTIEKAHAYLLNKIADFPNSTEDKYQKIMKLMYCGYRYISIFCKDDLSIQYSKTTENKLKFAKTFLIKATEARNTVEPIDKLYYNILSGFICKTEKLIEKGESLIEEIRNEWQRNHNEWQRNQQCIFCPYNRRD
jgi:hypothetical protein